MALSAGNRPRRSRGYLEQPHSGLPRLSSGFPRRRPGRHAPCGPVARPRHAGTGFPAGMHSIELAIRDLVAQALCQLPSGERLRIIELGAGRPSFAAIVCKELDVNRCDYTFATTASAVPEEWHSLQERFPAAELRQLTPDENLETAAIPAAGQFQLALITADFDTEQDALLSLAYSRRHLSPGGSVLVIEQHQSRWMDFVFGARRAWWSAAADDSWTSRHRPAQFWRHQMQRMGFQAGVSLELSGDGA